jgi:hypothetical protein
VISQLFVFGVTRVGHVALKSTSPQVRKFFFVALQRKLRFSKAQLHSVHFKLLDATFYATLMTGIGAVELIRMALIVWWLSPAPGNLKTRFRILRTLEFIGLVTFLFNEVAIAFFAL